MKKLALLLGLQWAALAHAQQCSPDYLEADDRRMKAGEYRSKVLVTKLQELMKEIKILSTTPVTDSTQRKPMEHCRSKKSEMFQTMMTQAQRIDPDVLEDAGFQEVNGDFYALSGNHTVALGHYDRALKANPQSLQLRVKSLFEFIVVENLRLDKFTNKLIKKSEKPRVFQELAERAAKVSDHPDANKATVIEAFLFQATAAQNLGNDTGEMTIWEKVLAVDPKNEMATRNRWHYFVSKQQIPEVTVELRRLIRNEQIKPEDWVAYLQLLAQAKKFDEYISWIKKMPAPIGESYPIVRAYLARAYLVLGRRSEAEAVTNTLPSKLTGKAAFIAAQNHSILLEIQGDDLKKQNRLSEALDAYKTALKTSPNPLTINEKISLLIYEYRKKLNFQPLAATITDLKEVVDLLEKSAFETELKSDLFEIFLHSAKLTKSSALAKACNRYQELYPNLITGKAYQNYCR